MADPQSHPTQQRAQGQSVPVRQGQTEKDVSKKKSTTLQRRGEGPSSKFLSRLPLVRQLVTEMDRLFDDFGLSPRLLMPLMQRWPSELQGQDMFAPDIEVVQQHNNLVIRADLPGLSKSDIEIEVLDDRVMLRGERRQEYEESRGGIFHSERSYGSFYRVVPLPEGADTERAEATFKEGVLEIRMPLPQQASAGRRLEIKEHAGKAPADTKH